MQISSKVYYTHLYLITESNIICCISISDQTVKRFPSLDKFMSDFAVSAMFQLVHIQVHVNVILLNSLYKFKKKGICYVIQMFDGHITTKAQMKFINLQCVCVARVTEVGSVCQFVSLNNLLRE